MSIRRSRSGRQLSVLAALALVSSVLVFYANPVGAHVSPAGCDSIGTFGKIVATDPDPANWDHQVRGRCGQSRVAALDEPR